MVKLRVCNKGKSNCGGGELYFVFTLPRKRKSLKFTDEVFTYLKRRDKEKGTLILVN